MRTHFSCLQCPKTIFCHRASPLTPYRVEYPQTPSRVHSLRYASDKHLTAFKRVILILSLQIARIMIPYSEVSTWRTCLHMQWECFSGKKYPTNSNLFPQNMTTIRELMDKKNNHNFTLKKFVYLGIIPYLNQMGLWLFHLKS